MLGFPDDKIQTVETNVTDNVANNDYNSPGFGPKISPPITLLQEICSRNGFTAEYQLLSTEGRVHEPTFKIAVTVADITVTASGQSKKKARHAAAQRAIKELRNNRPNLIVDGIDFDSMSDNVEPSAKNISSNEPNPVGKLQEICMKISVNPPDYETCHEKGLDHERVFVLSCSIASLDLTTLGEGRSKKLAKRQAAEHMLTKLESTGIYYKATSNKPLEPGANSIHMDSDDNSQFVKTRCHVTELCHQLGCSVNDLWTDINLIEQDDVNEDLFYELIQETVQRVGHCQFNWMTDNHCILNIYDQNDNLVLTGFGLGKDNASAMKNSVINSYKLMITYLKPLINKDLPKKVQ